jgi:nucleoside recognition membrane protein YjiH
LVRKPNRDFSQATAAEIFSALRDSILPSVFAALLLGVPAILITKGGQSASIGQFVHEVPSWPWIAIACTVAVSFPGILTPGLRDAGHSLIALSEFWGTRPLWKRALLLLFVLLVFGAFAVSLLLGLWLLFFVGMFVSSLTEALHDDSDD